MTQTTLPCWSCLVPADGPECHSSAHRRHDEPRAEPSRRTTATWTSTSRRKTTYFTASSRRQRRAHPQPRQQHHGGLALGARRQPVFCASRPQEPARRACSSRDDVIRRGGRRAPWCCARRISRFPALHNVDNLHGGHRRGRQGCASDEDIRRCRAATFGGVSTASSSCARRTA